MKHLILHKVRGEPTFDVAVEIDIGSEKGWIIPTSGHRAYPYWNRPVSEMLNGGDLPEMPVDWPDHYQANDKPSKHIEAANKINIFDFINIPPPAVKLVRRRI